MIEPQSVDQVTGEGTRNARFAQLNIDGHLHPQAYVDMCLSSISRNLDENFGLFQLRREGIALLLYSLEIENGTEPLAFNRPLDDVHTARLHRVHDSAPGGQGAPRERLILDQNFQIFGYRRSGNPEELGFDDGSGDRVPVGTSRLIQIFTRPLAPPGERQVSEAPGRFAALKIHPWEGGLPTVTSLGMPPRGLDAAEPVEPAEINVWGRESTDTNQHVTVTEYMRALINRLNLLLHRAGLAVNAHHIRRLRIIFRRPFFPGDLYTVDGRLYVKGNATHMSGGIYALDRDGARDGKPAVFAQLEGTVGITQGP